MRTHLAENNNIYPFAKTHLEKVVLVHNTAVGQSLDQLIGQGGFAAISDPVDKNDDFKK